MLANLSLVALVAAALSGSGLAQRPPPADTCTVGQFYCGNYLMSGSNNQLWKSRIDKALEERNLPKDGPHEFDSLFFCSEDRKVVLDEFCLGQRGNVCQPFNSDKCRGSDASNKNDCCGPAN